MQYFLLQQGDLAAYQATCAELERRAGGPSMLLHGPFTGTRVAAVSWWHPETEGIGDWTLFQLHTNDSHYVLHVYLVKAGTNVHFYTHLFITKASVTVGIGNEQKIAAHGINYSVPWETGDYVDTPKEFAYHGESVTVSEVGGQLMVNGKSYGRVKSGDTVSLMTKGVVQVNGIVRGEDAQ